MYTGSQEHKLVSVSTLPCPSSISKVIKGTSKCVHESFCWLLTIWGLSCSWFPWPISFLIGNSWHYFADGTLGGLAKECSNCLALLLSRLPKLPHDTAEWGSERMVESSFAYISWVHFLLWVLWGNRAQRLWGFQQSCTSCYFGESDCSPGFIVSYVTPQPFLPLLGSTIWTQARRMSPCSVPACLPKFCGLFASL